MVGSLLLSCVILTVVGHSAVAIPPILLLGGYGKAPDVGGYEEKPLTLTCALNFTDGYKTYKGVANALAVTIKENPRQYGGIHSYGGDYGGSGLTATIDIYSTIGGPVVVAITEKARPEDGCYSEHFGSFLNSKSGHGGDGAYGGMGGYGGLGGYGGYGGVGDYGGIGGYGYGHFGYGGKGLFGYGGKGGSYGGGYGKGYESKDDDSVDDIPGVIAKVTLAAGTTTSVTIDHLSEFSSLEDLAGRGVIVCPKKSVDADYSDAYCEGGILSCCALHYDDGYQKLYGKY